MSAASQWPLDRVDVHYDLQIRPDGTYSASPGVDARKDTKRYLALLTERRRVALAFLKAYDQGTLGKRSDCQDEQR